MVLNHIAMMNRLNFLFHKTSLNMPRYALSLKLPVLKKKKVSYIYKKYISWQQYNSVTFYYVIVKLLRNKAFKKNIFYFSTFDFRANIL